MSRTRTLGPEPAEGWVRRDGILGIYDPRDSDAAPGSGGIVPFADAQERERFLVEVVSP